MGTHVNRIGNVREWAVGTSLPTTLLTLKTLTSTLTRLEFAPVKRGKKKLV